MKADKYYGEAAKNYDAARCHSLRWANEQRAVADMVFSGPVLDCPLGTARFASIYRGKGLDFIGVDISADMLAVARNRYPEIDARQGSIFALPFEDKTFATVVCTRLLDWLSPTDMGKAVAELRRMADIIIVTIRHGPEECRTNWTHSLARFYEQIQGLFICARRTTEITRDGVEEIFRLRPPLWSDLTHQFRWHGHTPEFEAYRLGAEWSERFGFKAPIISEQACTLRSEYWTHSELGAVIDQMALHHPAYRTESGPRFDEQSPATILETSGKRVVLDGRRRINQWRKTPGRYPVLVVEA